MADELASLRSSSTAAAKHFNTWLWRHVYCPWERLTLHPDRIWRRLHTPEHSVHASSSPNHWFKFWGDGSTSYVAPNINLILLASMLHRSLHLIFFFSTPSQFTHCPCFSCDTALVQLTVSSCLCISSTTIFLFSPAEALPHEGLPVSLPKPPTHAEHGPWYPYAQVLNRLFWFPFPPCFNCGCNPTPHWVLGLSKSHFHSNLSTLKFFCQTRNWQLYDAFPIQGYAA